MNLFDVLREECVCANSEAGDFDSVLDEVVRLATASSLLPDVTPGEIRAALVERENLGSTAFGGGIAIPHCRLEKAKEFVVGLISLEKGIDFKALDGEPVRLIVFIVAPASETNEHIRLLSGISQVLSIPGSLAEMLASPSKESLREAFLRHVADEVDAEEGGGQNLVQVLVQDEDNFREILRVFGGMETSHTVVLTGEDTSAYLSKMPLFAGFWSDDATSSCYMILSVVNKKLVNESIRRIERVVGPIRDARGTLVLVQELFYCAGALNA